MCVSFVVIGEPRFYETSKSEPPGTGGIGLEKIS